MAPLESENVVLSSKDGAAPVTKLGTMKWTNPLLHILATALIASPAVAADLPPDGSCLVERWAEAPPTPADRLYDIDHDYRGENNPGFISCAGFTTASALRNSLANVQRGLRENNAEVLKREFLFPLRINGTRTRTVAESEFVRSYAGIITPNLANFIQTLTIDDVMVAGYRGAALGNGFMWFQNDKADKRPKVAVINLGVVPK